MKKLSVKADCNESCTALRPDFGNPVFVFEDSGNRRRELLPNATIRELILNDDKSVAHEEIYQWSNDHQTWIAIAFAVDSGQQQYRYERYEPARTTTARTFN